MLTTILNFSYKVFKSFVICKTVSKLKVTYAPSMGRLWFLVAHFCVTGSYFRIDRALEYVVVLCQIKAGTHEGFCSRSMLQGHAPGAKLLRVYQGFHGYTSSLGAEFPPRKMLHDIKPAKYLGASFAYGVFMYSQNPSEVSRTVLEK